MDNNILVAASPDVKDWTQCLAVELPQGSAFRASVNLVDNPDVLGKSILVNGSLSTFLGMPGITGNGGTADDVEVDGVTIGGGETPGGESIPAGNGTKESPYNADQIKSATPATGMWMEGYVVGYVADKAWDTAVFGTEPSETDNYKNATNVVLSMVAPGKADASNSVPVGLKKVGDVRTTLGISKNPSIYGARVKVKGEVTSYFGMTSMKNVEEYVIVSGGEGGGDTPTPDVPDNPSTGDGTEANPFDVAYISASTADATGVWVVGYVAGYIADKTWDTAVFGTQATDGSTNYQNGTNLILSSVAPTGSDANNSVPVAIPSGNLRDVLAVGKNPDIYGKKVLLKGDITKYFGRRGFKNISEYKIVE